MFSVDMNASRRMVIGSAIAALGCIVALLSAHAFAAAPDLGTTNVGWQAGPDTPQVAQALDKGYWTQRGLTVHTIPTATGREALELLIGGQLDYAFMAELPPVIGAMQHQNFRIIAQIAQYNAMRVISTQPIDASFKSLAGRKIGATLGTNMDFQAYQTLQAAGSKASSLNLAPSDIVPALSRGDIDAGFMFPQFYSLAKKALGDRYNERRTPNYKQTFVLVATIDEITKHPDRVRALLAGLLQANEVVAQDAPETSVVVSKAMNGLVTPASLQALWVDYNFNIMLDRGLVQLMQQEAVWLHEGDYIKGPAPSPNLITSYIDPSFLGAMSPRTVTIK
jgi:NitT/TauT family transport system substrate-binding protein